MSLPLDGVRVVEIAALGPTPMCGMLLADLGADVVRVDRLDGRKVAGVDPDALCARGKRSIAISLKDYDGVELVLRLAERAQVFLEGFRPGVAEQLGIGPDSVTARNSSIVYARNSGWGQEGPLAHCAGHDINYIAVAGILHGIGSPDGPPVPPLALAGDLAGAAVTALGVTAAVFDASRSGCGRILDAGVVGVAGVLATPFYEMLAQGRWSVGRGENMVDGSLPFYRTYGTSDGRYVAVGAIEPQFYAALLSLLGLDREELPAQMDSQGWPELHDRFAAAFRTRTRDEWASGAQAVDACVAPVLDLAEAPHHPYNTDRGGFVDVGGVSQPAPSPTVVGAPAPTPAPPPTRGQHTEEILRELGVDAAAIGDLRHRAIVG